MAQKVDLGLAFGLPPKKAIRYFRSKGHVVSWNWNDTLGAAHAKAFTVAKVTNMEVLKDIRSEVDKAISEGVSFADFKKELEPKLKKKGWWGKKFVVGPDGRTEQILEGSPNRLKHIYRQNVQSAYNAGREEFFLENIDNRPFGQYIAVLDSRTRDVHRKLDGRVYRLDDPFWDFFTPPIDHECRCRKRALSERALKKRGLKVRSSKGKIGKKDALVSSRTGELKPVTFIKDANGTEIATGIGFDFNPAKAAWQPDLDNYDLDIAQQYLKGAVTGPDFGRFFAGEIGGNFPVDRIDKIAKGIDTNSDVVKFSQDSLLKNRGLLERSTGHPDLAISDYELLPEILSDAQVVVRHGENKFQFFYEKKGVIYSAATKVTGNGEIFLQTFFKSRKSYMNSRMKKGTVVKNSL